MKHYVIINDWVNEYENGVNILGVVHSLDEAKEIFNKYVRDEKNYAEENGFEIYDNSDVEFYAGREGYCRVDHTRLYIQGV